MYPVDVFARNGFAFPIRGVAAEQCADWRERYEFYEGFLGLKGAPRILRAKPHLAFTWMFELIRHPAVLDALEHVIGPDILCVGSIVWIKEPHDGKFVSWHQDSAYGGYEPEITCTSWLAITPSTPESGCVQFIRGSHAWAPQLHEETFDPNNLLSRGQTLRDIDTSRAVDAVLQPGEFSVHHACTVHGSRDNRSDQRRIGFSGIYCSPHVRSTIGGRGANLVRGTDRCGNWEPDPEPRFDLDPVCIAAADAAVAAYVANKRQSATMR